MKNWKTTLGGTLSALGLSLSASSDHVTHTVGIVCAAVGTLLLGSFGKDNNVTGGTTQQ